MSQNGRENMSAKESLLGNGTLTVISRLMGAIGVPLSAIVLGFIWSELWSEVKANRVINQTILIRLGTYDEKFVELARRNDQQDAVIERLREAVRRP